MMRFNIFVSTIIATVLTAQTPIAVIEFTGKNVPQVDASILTDRLRIELFKLNMFNVIEREMMDQILKEQGFQQSGCLSNECIVEVGKLIGVEEIVGGSISRVGNIFSITARIVSVKTGEIMKTSTYDHSGVIDELLMYGMKHIAYELSGISAPIENSKNVSEYSFPEIENSLSSSSVKKLYIEGLTNYNDSNYAKAIGNFERIITENNSHPLAFKAQYWKGECYYSQKNYKRAIIEFEKVFTFAGTDKDDDAQLKLGLAYQSMGNLEKSREEYQRLIDYFPGSEFYDRAKFALKQLTIE